MFENHPLKPITIVADTISAGAVVGAIMGYFTPLAALAAMIWYAIQIWESKTVRGLRARWFGGEPV